MIIIQRILMQLGLNVYLYDEAFFYLAPGRFYFHKTTLIRPGAFNIRLMLGLATRCL